MAERATFETNELLEAILLHLPMLDMLTAKSGCRQWKALIERSLALRRALVLACDAGSCVQLARMADCDRFGLPHLQHHDLNVLPIFRLVLWSISHRNPEVQSFERDYIGIGDYYKSRIRYTFQVPIAQLDLFLDASLDLSGVKPMYLSLHAR